MATQQDYIDGLYKTPEWLMDRRKQEFPKDEDLAQLSAFIRENSFIERALELGSGTGYIAKKLVEQFPNRPFKITGLEFLQKYVDYATMQAEEHGLAHRLEYVEGDIRQHIFNKGKYDLVFSIWSSFCQINTKEQQELLSRLERLLKPGQKIYIDVTDWDGMREYEERLENETERLIKSGTGDYMLIWDRDNGSQPIFYFHSKERWREIFRNAGFNVEIRPYNPKGRFEKYRNRMTIIGEHT